MTQQVKTHSLAYQCFCHYLRPDTLFIPSISCPSQLACKCCLSMNDCVTSTNDTFNAYIIYLYLLCFCLARFALHQLLPRRNSIRTFWRALSTLTRVRWSTPRPKKRTHYRLLKVYFYCFIICALWFKLLFFIPTKYSEVPPGNFICLLFCLCVVLFIICTLTFFLWTGWRKENRVVEIGNAGSIPAPLTV